MTNATWNRLAMGLLLVVILTAFSMPAVSRGRSQTPASATEAVSSIVTVDGTRYTTIQTALNALTSRGGTVVVPPGYSQDITSTLLFPPRAHVIFAGPSASLTCDTGMTDCIQFTGESDSIDGYCVYLPEYATQCTSIVEGTTTPTTGDIIHIAWTTSVNAVLTGENVKNLSINMMSGTNEAINCTSCWFSDFENLYLYNLYGNGIHFQDDKPGSTNGLMARFLYLKDIYTVQEGGTGTGVIFDSLNGRGISEVTGINLHSEGNGGGLRALFTAGPASGWAGQNSQMQFIGWHMFNSTATQYAVEFRAPTGSSYRSLTGGLNTNLIFDDLGLENEVGITPTVPAFTCTLNGSRNGAACGAFQFNSSGAAGYQNSFWPDGFDYTNLGFASLVIQPSGQANVMGVSAIFTAGLRAAQYTSDLGVSCTNGELALSAGWGSKASVSGVVGTGQTCEWTITSSGTGQEASPTITDALTNPLPSASTVCNMQMVGGTGTSTMIDQTTLSATAPVFTFAGTPVAVSTYKVVRRCGP